MLALLLVLAAASPYQESLAKIARERGKDAQRLHRIFDLAWEHDNDERPEVATLRGVPGRNARWTDLSLEAFARRKRETISLAEAVRTIDRSKLGAKDQLDHDVFRRIVEEDVRSEKFPQELLPVTQLAGPQYLSNVIDLMPARTLRDYQDILARLDAIPPRLAQTEALLRRGIETSVVAPRVILRDVPAQLAAQAPDDPLQAPLLKAFVKLPEGVPEQTREQAVRTYREKIAPALTRFREFFVGEYLPRARDTVALTALPDGAAWYAQRVRRETTTDLTPQQIHELGLSEVKRILGEMEKAKQQAGFTGTLAELAVFLRSDPRFYFKDARELVREYRDIAKRADGYGLPGVVVDGQEIDAVYEATAQAVARARANQGPTLVEAKTYRFDEHQVGFGVADPEHQIRAQRRKLTALTIADESAQLFQRRGLLQAGIAREHFDRRRSRARRRGGAGVARRYAVGRDRRGRRHASFGSGGARRRRRGQSFQAFLGELLQVIANRVEQQTALLWRARVAAHNIKPATRRERRAQLWSSPV